MQILVRCGNPGGMAARLFSQDHVVEAKLNGDGKGVLVRTRDAEKFYGLLNSIVVEEDFALEAVTPADDDVNSLYQYLIGGTGGQGGNDIDFKRVVRRQDAADRR